MVDERISKLYDKCEAMSVLCQKATNHWSLIKFIFQIPLILTSSVMCILNSFDDGKGNLKIVNVVVNGVSVLLISYQSNLKVAEKCELFKNLSNQFLQLAHDVEGRDHESMDRNDINNLIEKYDSFVVQCFLKIYLKNTKEKLLNYLKVKAYHYN
jgi:hypothetical protein